MKKQYALFLVILSFFYTVTVKDGNGSVYGECANCHTMHNSQNGVAVTESGTPNPNLLLKDCLGCHSAADGTTSIDPVTGAPIVYNISLNW